MATHAPSEGFSSVGYDEAMRRARALIPLLREEAPASERAGCLTPAVMDALHRSGLIRCLQPRVWGGMELDLAAYFDIPEMISRGDICAGWVLANLASHHRNLVWWPPRAQAEVWGADPAAGVAAGVAFPQGRGRRVDGGMMLTGEWSFSSGTDCSDWSMLGCIVREEDKPIDWVYCLVHRDHYETVDDWQVLGMRATGSKTVRCAEVFVPEHRVLSMHVARPGHSWPGLAVHRNPQYRV
ncbi:MAG: acyl-CoA dehydrogenase, partial [Betaproteobacteria bacterium]